MTNASEVSPREMSCAATSDASAPEMWSADAVVTAPMMSLVESEIVLPSSQAADSEAAMVIVTERSVTAPDLVIDAEPAASDHMLQQPGPGAVDLLRMLAPDGPWNVRTISSLSGGSPQAPKKLGYHVGPHNADDHENGIEGWLEAAEAGKHNCYLHVAVGPDGKAKLLKSDVTESRAAWVDVDPDPVRFEESRGDILAAMRREDPPFSCIVDSGNGYQAYKFIETYRINGKSDAVAELESRNLAICQSLRQGLRSADVTVATSDDSPGVKIDKCHSADHLMRLPDAVNFLTEKKRKKGYPPGDRRARIVDWHPERVYKLEDLPKATAEQAKGSKEGSTAEDDGAGKLSSEQLLELLSGLDPKNFRDGARWRSLLWACHHGTAGSGRQAFVEWSARDEQFATEQDKTGRAWDRARDERAEGITVGTLFHELKQAGQDDLVFRVLHSSGPLQLSAGNWPLNARKFVARQRQNLRHHNGDWLDYSRGAYREVEDAGIQADAHQFLNEANFKQKNKHVAELVGAVKRQTHVSREMLSPPCWLPGHVGPAPLADECIAFPNGILHLPSGTFYSPTPNFFTLNAVEFDYDPNAPEPKTWLKTLSDWWPPDAEGSASENISTLQEIFGYLLVPDTSQQKMFFLLGPPRSGKGVISRTMTQLIGLSNTSFPSMSSLGGEFGRMPLIGKQLAIVSELKLGRTDDPGKLAAILLAISGEDFQSVNRKNKGFWEGKLVARFLFLGNKIPTFADDGTALGNRLVILRMSNSFLGHEDLALEGNIKLELPGILNWAVAGWRRLWERGHFAETADGLDAKAEFIRLASPVLSFVHERCKLEVDQKSPVNAKDFETEKDALYAEYKRWCADNGRQPETKEDFGAALVACCAGKVREYRPEKHKPDGTIHRPRMWKGISFEDRIPF
jgi:P4 family phage/plasmid primase-like protien